MSCRPTGGAGKYDLVPLAQEILSKNEERLHLALEATSDGIWDWDIKNAKIYYSPRYFTLLGYKPDEFKHTLENMYLL